jgi:hypothetical protein
MEAVAYSLEYFFGTRPPEKYLAYYAAKIEHDHLQFIRNCLQQWPTRAISDINSMKENQIQRLQNIVSTGLLMAVPPDKFLELAYREFFARAVDDSGYSAYGKLDFTVSTNRTRLLQIFAKSPEFAESKRQIAWTKQAFGVIDQPSGHALRWHGGEAVTSDWFNVSSSKMVSVQFIPIILWVPERTILYAAPGMVIQGELRGNILLAPPEWVFWGPKTAMPKGVYKIRCEITMASNDVAIFEVCSAAGAIIHAKVEFFGDLKVELPLELCADASDVEMRLFNSTGRNIEIRIQEISVSSS